MYRTLCRIELYQIKAATPRRTRRSRPLTRHVDRDRAQPSFSAFDCPVCGHRVKGAYGVADAIGYRRPRPESHSQGFSACENDGEEQDPGPRGDGDVSGISALSRPSATPQ